jgi:dUTP pyrophosphatase
VVPFKTRVSDSGYDITLIEKIKQTGDVEFYTTGIKIKPIYGFYFDLVPRSSIMKTGYMLANSVGIIDQGYFGEVIAGLIKVDKGAPDLELPARILQIIPRQAFHIEWELVNELPETQRGEGGFGSTGV